MKATYRVEAFIVPRTIINEEELSTSNEIDDVKIANSKLKLASPSKSTVKTFFLEPRKEFNHSRDIDEPIYDVPCTVKSKSFDFSVNLLGEDRGLSIGPKIPVRTSSLVSIDERGENENILEEFCFHGYKDGCTVETKRPEDVSEEIFQDNWLRRLESLRQREANLGEKENLLQERERLLFKKERELRILERLVKEKLKQAELHLKLCQSSRSIESMNFDAKTRSSEDSQQSQKQRYKNEKSASNFVIRAESASSEKNQIFLNRDEVVEEEINLKPSDSTEHGERGALKNPPNSRSSLWSSANFELALNNRTVKTQGESLKSSLPAYSSLRTCRQKIRPKISYDDLDSTLSADVGDSSFVVTSKKFDPAVFKKPHAFTRTFSERRSKQDFLKQDSNRFSQLTNFQKYSSDEKILKRATENIVVISQSDKIKYQDYGPIDERSDAKENDEARNSYLNLERGIEPTRLEKHRPRNYQDRPISWNEETDEWLRKKRRAYNMATMRISDDNFENKENADSAIIAGEKLKKLSKKKESRTKKFGIFR